MSGTKRKNFTGNLKAKVALEAICGIKTMNEIGQEFSGHPSRCIAQVHSKSISMSSATGSTRAADDIMIIVTS